MKDYHRKGYFKEYYSKPEVKERQKEYMNKRRKSFNLFIIDFKKDKFCKICGWKKYTEILQFHHRDPKKKTVGVAHTISRSKEVMLKEMEKCILLCPNCHMWHHYKENTKVEKEI